MDETPDPDLVLGHPETDRRTVTVIAAALVVIVVGIGIGFVALSPTRSGGGGTGSAASKPKIAASLPTPATLTRDAVTYRATEVPATAAMRDPADPDAVRVYAFAAYESDSPQCSSFSPSARVIGEGRTSVTIATFAYESKRPSGTYGCSFLSSAGQPLYTQLPLHLTQALGNRTLVDADTGKDIGIVDPTYVPDATYLPAGYTSGYSGAARAGEDLTSNHDYHRGRDDVQIRTASATNALEMGPTIGHGTVNHHPATISQQDNQRCVTWTPTVGLVDSVCAQSQDGNLLSTVELVKVASSVR